MHPQEADIDWEGIKDLLEEGEEGSPEDMNEGGGSAHASDDGGDDERERRSMLGSTRSASTRSAEGVMRSERKAVQRSDGRLRNDLAASDGGDDTVQAPLWEWPNRGRRLLERGISEESWGDADDSPALTAASGWSWMGHCLPESTRDREDLNQDWDG